MFIQLKSIKTNVLLATLLLTLVGCKETAETQSIKTQKPVLRVEGFKVHPTPFNDDVTTTADLLPNEQVTLMAPMEGQVLGVYFKEGATVSKGARIIRIYDKNWKAQLVGLNAELETVRKDVERKQALLEIGGSTQEEIDLVYARSETLKSQIQQLQLNIELANVRAPFSGVLGMRDFSEGAFLTAGQEITTLTELKQLKVDFTLPQEYISNIQKGTKVHVLVTKDTLEATVYAINPRVDVASRTINVRALLKQPANKKIMPGTFAEVLVSTHFIKDALLVPTQSVVPEINDQTVYLYKNGKAVRKTVQLGIRTADMIHIVTGIAPEDTLITSGLLQVKDGMNIDLQSVK